MSSHPDLTRQISQGGYAKKQILSKSRLIAWSHGSRFKMARALVSPFAGKRLLDYGCGDGTFLAMVHDLFPDASIGCDLDARQNAEAAERFEGVEGLSFHHTTDMNGPNWDGTFDVVTCMEVLEHCVPSAVEKVLGDLKRLVKPDGMVLISVPVEIGPTLLIKEGVRKVAGWRGLGDYRHKERYRLGELLKMTFAGKRTTIVRKGYASDFGNGIVSESYGHKGFNWKVLRTRLEQDFEVQRPRFTPVGGLLAPVSSQVWLRCRPRA